MKEKTNKKSLFAIILGSSSILIGLIVLIVFLLITPNYEIYYEGKTYSYYGYETIFEGLPILNSDEKRILYYDNESSNSSKIEEGYSIDLSNVKNKNFNEEFIILEFNVKYDLDSSFNLKENAKFNVSNEFESTLIDVNVSSNGKYAFKIDVKDSKSISLKEIKKLKGEVEYTYSSLTYKFMYFGR